MEPITVIVESKHQILGRGTVWHIKASDNPQLLDNDNWWIPMKGIIVKEEDGVEHIVRGVEMVMSYTATVCGL